MKITIDCPTFDPEALSHEPAYVPPVMPVTVEYQHGNVVLRLGLEPTPVNERLQPTLIVERHKLGWEIALAPDDASMRTYVLRVTDDGKVSIGTEFDAPPITVLNGAEMPKGWYAVEV